MGGPTASGTFVQQQQGDSDEEEDSDDEFMQQYRSQRLQQLQTAAATYVFQIHSCILYLVSPSPSLFVSFNPVPFMDEYTKSLERNLTQKLTMQIRERL